MNETIDITLPADQLEGTEATLSEWLVNIGDAVTNGQPVAELETDKVSVELAAPADGILFEIVLKPGDKVEPDTVLARLNTGKNSVDQQDSEGAAAGLASAPTQLQRAADDRTQSVASASSQGNGRNHNMMGPAVRKLVAEHNLDLDRINGTGRGGRVTRDDVIAYLESDQIKHALVPNAPASGSEDMAGRMVPHTKMRKIIANHMVDSLLHTSPHVTSVFEMDMSRVIKHRTLHKQTFAEQGVNLTFTAYFLSASATAMQTVPEINARFHDDALELFRQVNIGVGTALGDSGLVVPVVRHVEAMDLLDIARALHEQTERAREGKLTPADMKGGTFTISNHGVSGSLFAAPIIINQPQVAILGVGKMEKRVTVVEKDGDDFMVIKPMCYVSLSIDHRAVDAFQTNAWLSKFVDVIESWE